MMTLTIVIMFLLFTFECREFYEGSPRVRRSHMKWSAISESLRDTALIFPMRTICPTNLLNLSTLILFVQD
jgi:hypothetical protein